MTAEEVIAYANGLEREVIRLDALATHNFGLALNAMDALQKISDACPPYVGDYTIHDACSDFGNADDYAREMGAMSDARIGDIARAALAPIETEGGDAKPGSVAKR